MSSTAGRPFELVAHRHANDLALVAVAPPGADLVECDVHLHGRRLEVRHAKRLWPTRRLWERWYLLAPATPVPSFAQIVAAAPADVGLLVDLKGWSPRLALAARRVLDEGAPGREVVVSTKAWYLLRAFRDRPRTRTLRSAGNRHELALLRRLPVARGISGCVVHQRLLRPALVDELHRRYGLVLTWAAPDEATARRLLDAGVDGLILDDLSVVERLAASR